MQLRSPLSYSLNEQYKELQKAIDKMRKLIDAVFTAKDDSGTY